MYTYKQIQEQSIVYDFVELSAKYRRYIVVGKYNKKHEYYLTVLNPYKDGCCENVQITEHIYYHLYFVGDTIQ